MRSRSSALGALTLAVSALGQLGCGSSNDGPSSNIAVGGSGTSSVATAGSAGASSGAAGAVAGAAAGSSSSGASNGGGSASAGSAGSDPVGGATGGGGFNGGASGGGASGGGDTSGTCVTENCGTSCSVPTLPGYSALSANTTLPDPFLMMSGTRMTSKSQWECRRAELFAQFQNYEFGSKNPKAPGAVTGTASNGSLTVNVGGKSFTVTIKLPSTGTAPYPAIIGLDGGSLDSSIVAGLGVAQISFDTNGMGDQSDASGRGKGFFFDVNGADNGAGAVVAWAWGVSRVIDALEVTPAAQIDPKHLGITGCSRNGKGALAIGAFDERIALTIPQESGSGGTAAWRISDAENMGSTVQTLHEIIGENCWFSSSLNQFANTATKLPYDHHELLGMVAPRGLLILENTDYQWLGVNSCVNSATAAQFVFQGLGVPDNIGFSNSGHTHCAFNSAEGPYLKAYIQKFLLGQSVDTKVWNITKAGFNGSGTVDMAKWVAWTVPTLN